MRRRRVGLATLFFAGGVGAALAVWFMSSSGGDENDRFSRSETRVIVSNVAGASCSLFKAGRAIDESTAVREFNGSPIWLAPGNYFLRATDHQTTLLFPIPVTGYKSGPDDDGSFIVTIRPPPASSPPRLLPDLPSDVFIPSGTFLLGDRQNPRESHAVWLPAYFIAPFELSNAEFRVFLEARDGYAHPGHWTEEGLSWKGVGRGHSTALLTPSDPEFQRFGQDDQPVTWVTWFESIAYCRWLTQTRGKGLWQFSLPSEAEWEKAARGPDCFDYSLGNRVSDEEVGLYNWKKNPGAGETVVGWKISNARFRPNRYGLSHMTGNVAEWTRSLYLPYNREHPYAEEERNREEVSGSRVARGGSWYSASLATLLIPYRDAFRPSHSSQDIGFRIVAHPMP